MALQALEDVALIPQYEQTLTMPIPNLAPGPGETYDASQKPPPFGHALKPYFALDEDYVNLNNGQ